MAPLTRIVKSAAENIYPAEVEGCLNRHPAVLEAAIIGLPDPKWTQKVCAVVVRAEGPEGEAPPLIVVSHGGPTGSCSAARRWSSSSTSCLARVGPSTTGRWTSGSAGAATRGWGAAYRDRGAEASQSPVAASATMASICSA